MSAVKVTIGNYAANSAKLTDVIAHTKITSPQHPVNDLPTTLNMSLSFLCPKMLSPIPAIRRIMKIKEGRIRETVKMQIT